ncbi:uncharacterized protein PgNI_09889 [Pyricularia grisea]|uniref:Zn(2)-C6 fungal-type domain-containing protein n=1 Tax=Pyricularia grisea TaxID=148305 RepID=A0A6P8ARL4_PYRGI|nr:uncharacterized protein PgNI_09889 [Pyricularia grisea]TLD04753.1 hypothetical protein PgNI_09889 [Pyricularia grisea]
MAPTSSSTTPSSGGHSPEEQFRVVRKRNRIPLSCTPCRTRKKCDRVHPCGNCVRREGSDTGNCSYATPNARSRKNQSQSAATSPDDMQNRIDRLEGLVLALMNGGTADAVASAVATASTAASASTASSRVPGSGATPTTSASVTSSARADREDYRRSEMIDDDDGDESDIDNGLATSLGVLKVDAEKGKAMYIGTESWHTILSSISEVKEYFSAHKKELESSYEKVLQSKPASAREGPTFLRGAPPATEVELRAELPPKSSILTLCGRYFNSMDGAVTIIHAPTFHAMLRSHWQDPSKTPIMWIGMLYSILCLAMLSYHKVGDEPAEWKGRSLELASEYRMRTVQCLVTADYTKPCAYTVETMLLYLFGESSSRWDADFGLWLVSSVITRIAFRMGYHRDGKWFPSITPFQAEMRRRAWALVKMVDVMFSAQVSLPSMIGEDDFDTELPHNILDDEFGPETKVLPPSRPRTTPTPIAYMIAKAKLGQEMSNVLKATTLVGRQVPYDEILRLDARLREVVAELPPHLKMQPLDESHDPLTLIVARINIDVLVQKIFCILHRKYLPRSRENPRYAHSRRTAIEASMDTLRHLETIYRESQDGRLRSLKWFVTSLVTREFLLPAMLVGLDLHYDNQAGSSSQGRHDSHSQHFWTPQQREQMVKSLEMAQKVWEGFKDTSIEAYKASNAIRIVLEKVKSPQAPSPGGSRENGVSSESGLRGFENNPFGATSVKGETMQDHSAAMTLGMLSGMTPGTAVSPDLMQSPGGTTYRQPPPFGTDGFGNNFGSSTAAAMGGDMNMDIFSGFEINNNPGSPFPSFINNSANAPGFPANFDWDAFETYTQTTNFAADSFQFLGGNTAGPGAGAGSTEDPSFSFGNQDMSGR